MSSTRNKDEAGWVSCRGPRVMFLDLEELAEQRLISRELRLFACACCRHISNLIQDERSWQAVDVGERYADGNASRDELKAAYDAAELAECSTKQRIKEINSAVQVSDGSQDTEEWRLYSIDDWHPERRRLNAAHAASICAENRVISSQVDPKVTFCGEWFFARAAAIFAYEAGASRDRLESMRTAFLAGDKDYLMYEDRWQADLVRCVFRSPFGPIDTDKLDAEPRIREMAESIYSLRAFDGMPVLGKELAVSGCVDPELVSHCTNAPVHARGCWALDLARGFKRSC
jgi:hypothetical protein